MAGRSHHHELTRGVPPVRVGWLLARARREAGLHPHDLAAALDVAPRVVRRWESGASSPDDAHVRAIAQLLQRSVESLLPGRDVVSLAEGGGGLRVGSELLDVDFELETNEAILRRYVTAVRANRGVGEDRPFVVRQEDVAALAAILDVHDGDLERDLVAIVGLTPKRASVLRSQLVRRRLAAPVAGLALGVSGTFGAVALAAGSAVPLPQPVAAADVAPAATTAPAAQVALTQVGGAVALDRVERAPTTSATAVEAPQSTVPAVVPPAPSTSAPVPSTATPAPVVSTPAPVVSTPAPVVAAPSLAPQIGEAVTIEAPGVESSVVAAPVVAAPTDPAIPDVEVPTVDPAAPADPALPPDGPSLVDAATPLLGDPVTLDR
jgi:transcriptional regulator with XRE-family HTH domain